MLKSILLLIHRKFTSKAVNDNIYFYLHISSDINEKLSIIKEWSLSNHTRTGCLLIGYEAFRTLVFYHSYKNRANVSSERLEEIRLLVNKYLLTPGN